MIYRKSEHRFLLPGTADASSASQKNEVGRRDFLKNAAAVLVVATVLLASGSGILGPVLSQASGVNSQLSYFQIRGANVPLDIFYSASSNYLPNAWQLLKTLGVNTIRVAGGMSGDIADFNMNNYPTEWAQNLDTFLAAADANGMKVYFAQMGNQWGTLFNIVSPDGTHAYTPINTAKAMVDELAGRNSLGHDFITDPRVLWWDTANEVDFSNSTIVNWNLQLCDYIRSLGGKASVAQPSLNGDQSQAYWSTIEPILQGHVDVLEAHSYIESMFYSDGEQYAPFYTTYSHALSLFVGSRGAFSMNQLILDEFGASSYAGHTFTDAETQVYYQVVFDAAKANGIQSMGFFRFSTVTEDSYGILDGSDNPYGVYTIIQNNYAPSGTTTTASSSTSTSGTSTTTKTSSSTSSSFTTVSQTSATTPSTIVTTSSSTTLSTPTSPTNTTTTVSSSTTSLTSINVTSTQSSSSQTTSTSTTATAPSSTQSTGSTTNSSSTVVSQTSSSTTTASSTTQTSSTTPSTTVNTSSSTTTQNETSTVTSPSTTQSTSSVTSTSTVTSLTAQDIGYLRVVTNPAVASTVYVNGVAADCWGLNWVKLPPGTYTIHFSDVPGFATPADQTVTVTAGATTTVTGNFVQLGYLHVATNPALGATISIDGQPRNDWGAWLPLTPGPHTVHFGDVANFTTPADQQVSVVAGSTATVTGNYVPGPDLGPTGFGFLRVVTNPAVASSIYANNVLLNDWGLNWVKLPPGTYTIHFSDVPGFATPADQTVTVTAGATTTVTGNFVQLGYLHVATNPGVAVTISIDGVVHDDWGVWVPLMPGQHTVHFGDVPGYATPADQQVTVVAGTSVTVTGAYT